MDITWVSLMIITLMGEATYSDGTPVAMDAKPHVFPVRIKGPMTYTPQTAHEDFKANGYMSAQIKRGRAKSGYYYHNVGEGEGVSAVVPNGDHLERVKSLPNDKQGQLSNENPGKVANMYTLDDMDPKTAAIRAMAMQYIAHDGGSNSVIFHCPFCGSGQVIGRSDGTVECSFCNTNFTVQVQPEFMATPQTIQGDSQDMSGMPGQNENLIDPAEDADNPGMMPANGAPDEQDENDPGDEEDENPGDGGNSNPFDKSSSRYYITTDDNVLNEDKYIKHLAIKYADDPITVIDQF